MLKDFRSLFWCKSLIVTFSLFNLAFGNVNEIEVSSNIDFNYNSDNLTPSFGWSAIRAKYHLGKDAFLQSGTPLSALAFGHVAYINNMPNSRSNCTQGTIDSGLGSVIETRMLKTSGEYLIASFNHLHAIEEHLNFEPESNFLPPVVKGQVISHSGGSAFEDNSFYDNCRPDSGGAHLHLELRSHARKSRFNFPNDIDSRKFRAPWGWAESIKTYDKSYRYNSAGRIFDNTQKVDYFKVEEMFPRRFCAEVHDEGESKPVYCTNEAKISRDNTNRIALPRFSLDTSSESYDSIFGYENIPVKIESGLTNTSFNIASVVVRDFFQRFKVKQKGDVEDHKRFISGNKDGGVLSDLQTYDRGNYLFTTFVRELPEEDVRTLKEVDIQSELKDPDLNDRYGYPVKFSFLSESEIIVDNDQNNSSSGTEFYKIGLWDTQPGYFLTSITAGDLDPKNSLQHRVGWEPRRRGLFKISAHIPALSIGKRQKVRVCPKGLHAIQECKSMYAYGDDPDNPWVDIVDENGESHVFEFSEHGFVQLTASPNSDSFADAFKFSYFNNDVEKVRLKLGLDEGSTFQHKILRHFMEASTDSFVNMGNSTSAQFNTESFNGVNYNKYTYAGKSVYINTSTHKVVNIVQDSLLDLWIRFRKKEVDSEGVIYQGGDE